MRIRLSLVVLFLASLNFVSAATRTTMDSSAHDLRNESTDVSCLNCHWMHQRGSDKGYNHSLISEKTRYVCLVCHGYINPNSNAAPAYLTTSVNKNGAPYLPPGFFKYKPVQYRGANVVYFSGQPGFADANIYNIEAEYQLATAALGGSYHMFFGSTYSAVTDTAGENIFSCFDCHNHGVDSTGYPGGRLPKLLWSKGAYPGISKERRENIDSCYATEYYCLSCHSNYGYPGKWNGLPWDSAKIQIDAVNFQKTKHSVLERWGLTKYGESRNPYGHGNDISCFVCHARHASAYPALMRGNYDENTMCQQCHYGVTPKLDITFAFTYRLETTVGKTIIFNYITAGHFADKQWTTVYGHGKGIASGGAGLKCSNCHASHGNGHYKMVKTKVTNPRDGATYVLNASQISDLDSALVSGFCGGSCHNLKSPDNDMKWWCIGAYGACLAETTRVLQMASSYRGKTAFDLSKHKDAVNSTMVQGYKLQGCASCHDSHGTQNKALTWGSEEALCFQCHSASGGAKDIEKYFNTTKSGKSHHPVDSAEQTDSCRVECINCHNPHLATKQYPTIYPYDWSVISDFAPLLNTAGVLGVVDHENRAKFCASCHLDVFTHVASRYDSTDSSWAYCYPPGVRIEGGKSNIAAEWFDAGGTLWGKGSSGHYKRDSTCLIDCINCHNPHGSSNPSNIRDNGYQDAMSSYADNFVTAVYNNFGAYDSFYNQNTQRSRKFCFSANGSSGCHLPQYLATQVVFPDSLGVSATHHNSRNVPYGDTAGSYYVDEHNPYWDTNTVNASPPSGVWGCSVCHYNAHNPTPNTWYGYAGKTWGEPQYCLDCHHPAESTSYNAATGKFLGGAPTKYESTFVEFFSTTAYPLSTTYISKHLKNAGINEATSGYCERCHGKHYKGWGCYYSDQYHDVPGSFVSSPNQKYDVYLTDYLNGQSFCLACHKGGIEAFGTVAANMGVYNTAGHGRLGIGGDGIKVYCFDCHTKHASQNPYLLRTKIRDVITYPGVRDRSVRTEDLSTTNSVSVKVDGYQSVCFACHSSPGTDRDSSEYGEINAKDPNPGTILWLGKTVYESSGHGDTYITPYAYVDTAYFGTTVVGGMSCSPWCHEPHGRGTDNGYNDDMLKKEGNVGLCYECHNTTLVAQGYEIANIKALFDTAASTHNISCLNCHNPHTGNKEKPVVMANYRTATNIGDDEFCLSCHCNESKVPTYAHGNPPPDVLFPTRSVSEEFFTGYDKSYYTASAHGKKPNEVYCKTCHKPHGTNKPDLLREVYNFNQDTVLGGHNYDTILTDTVTYGTAFVDYKEEEVCFGCHRSHTGESDWNPAWVNIPDIRKFYYGTRSHHNVFASEQVATDTKVECESCHNQHIATKEKPLTNPDAPDQAMSASGDECISFCLKCHDNEPPPGITGLTDEKYENIGAAYKDSDNNGVYDSFTGHYRQRDGKPHQCRLCHSMHGSNFAKQIQDATDSAYDTFKMVRNMRPVRLPVTNPLGGNDTFFLSSTVEICLSCHSGETQFYDGDKAHPEWMDIPLPPPSKFLERDVPVVSGHPEMISTAAANYRASFANGKKTVKSVYSRNMVNVNDDTINKVGCICHKAHNPYMTSTGEFSNCYNCHDAVGGIETSFDTSKFIGGPAPLAHDDNTLLMLHLDGSYEGTSKEQPVEGGKVGLRSVTGRYGLGVSFETAYATTKLVYPLWTSKATGAPGQPGIQHNETTDLTIRFNGTSDDEDAKGGIYRNSCSCSTGVDYVEGYIPGMYGAARLDINDTLTYYSSASAYKLSPRANINISSGSFVAWVKVEEPRNGYIFLHATGAVKNAIFLRHSSINTWDIGVSDETGLQSSIVSTEDKLTTGWHHIAGTWSRANRQLKLYIDGRLAASEGAQFFPSSTAETFRIGPIKTCIDEVQVSNYTKTDEEILEDYNCQNEINFDPRSGTLSFWVKPYWNGNDNTNHCFFESYYDGNNYFVLQKTFANSLDVIVKSSGAGAVRIALAVTATSLPKDVWSHIAVSWGDSGPGYPKMNLYLNDREPASSYTATMMGYTDTAIYFGSRKDGTESVRAVMDEIWITDVMLDSSTIYGIYDGNSNVVVGPITDPADGYLHYEGGSRHPINYDTAGFAADTTNVSKMECLKCHLQLESSHMEGVVKFVNVDSSMDWNKRVSKYDNGTKRGVTLFCLSCHMNPKADPLDGKYVGTTNSPYRFTGSGGADPIQLRPLEDDKPKLKVPGNPSKGYYYPIDTASAHFDTSFGAGAFGDLSCTDCHDPHGSINKALLQDFEEAKEKRDYNRDGIMTREIQYLDRENVRLYQLNEEKFCYFCHGGAGKDKGKFNGDGKNRGWQMKDIEGKFAHSGAHHIVDDEEQAKNDVMIECTSCHNPHTAKRDAVVLNPQTGARTYVADAAGMNSFCIGCHGNSAISPVILTGWCKGVKFPGLDTNEVASEWSGNSWNEFNKQSMVSGCKHYGNIACAACHDPHGTSNYRMLCETGGVYGLKLMLQTKPDGRERYEVYSTAGYSINKFCFGCHIDSVGVYPGKTAYELWDFGIVDSSSKYDSLTRYDSLISGNYKYMAPDVYGKDKDCDYCHNPHSSSTFVRNYMVRDKAPQDLDRNSPNYGNRIDSAYWFKEGFPATGVDFCLSKGCHVTNRFAKLGPRDTQYKPGGDSSWAYKPYDQFNLLDYTDSSALQFSGIRQESFDTGGSYTTARASKHPIVKNKINSSTLICLDCHNPHGSPGNTELAKKYSVTYESTYPQDNAALKRAYYRRIYWWPVTFWKRGDPSDVAAGRSHGRSGGARSAWIGSEVHNDAYGNIQNYAYYSIFGGNGNPVLYNTTVIRSAVPSAGNDLCYMCHPMADVAGTTGIGVNLAKTRFIGHEAVIGGSRIGETKLHYNAAARNIGLNFNFDTGVNDFHKFTCSTCHGPHAATNEKLITNKCFAYNREKPRISRMSYNNEDRPSVHCHPYDNSGTSNWDTVWDDSDADEGGIKFYGWRDIGETTTIAYSGPPSVSLLDVNVAPKKESGYDSVSLSWSGSGNNWYFKNYKVIYRSEMPEVTSDTTWKDMRRFYDVNNTTWTMSSPEPSYLSEQSPRHKFGGFVYNYSVVARDLLNNSSTTNVVRRYTRPPPRPKKDDNEAPSPGFDLKGESGSNGTIKLTWTDMYQYSYETDYVGAAAGYNIYAKETTGTISRIFKSETLEIDTAYGIRKIGTVPAIVNNPYPAENQVFAANVTASSNTTFASNAKDGQTATFWRADTYDTSSTAYIEFDLGAPREIASIVYSNCPHDVYFNTRDTTQGYKILVAGQSKTAWETVATASVTTIRGTKKYVRTASPIKYIKVTNFTHSVTDYPAGLVTELEAYYPEGTNPTTFVHSCENTQLSAQPGHSYAYGIYLEDSTGAKSVSAYSTTSYLVKTGDVEKPSPVVDLIAFGSSVDNKIRLKWSRPYDNIGVAKYEIWRREGNPDILDGKDDQGKNVRLSSTWTTELFVDDDQNLVTISPYWYAVCAVDSAGNRSDFTGTAYSASARKGVDRDTIPPEPATLESYSYSKSSAEVTLNWKQGCDRKDYDTAGQADTALYAASGYNIYRADTPFDNVVAPFGDWVVGAGTSKVIDGIDGSAKKLVIYNCVGNPRKELADGGVSIKSAGYGFATSAHYVFGVWLKAEGQFSTTYAGDVRLDIVTASDRLARRTLIKPCNNWTYYMLNFLTPASGLDSADIMIWANSNGTVWLDSARLVYLGKPKVNTNDLTWYDLDVNENSTYYYVVTSVDASASSNEGDFANSLRVVCKESGPVFDSAFAEDLWDTAPGNPYDGNNTGTTPTISLVVGEDNVDNNVFTEKDWIILKFRIKDALTGKFDSTVLDKPYGDIRGTVDGAKSGYEGGTTGVDDFYIYRYKIEKIEKASTQLSDSTWTGLARIEVEVTNKDGNGPAVDTTYQCILDPNPTEAVK